MLGTGSVWDRVRLGHIEPLSHPRHGAGAGGGTVTQTEGSASVSAATGNAFKKKKKESNEIIIKKISQGKIKFQMKRNHSKEMSPGKYLYIR